MKLDDQINMEAHIRLCQFGIARTNIKIGDFRRGVSLHISHYLLMNIDYSRLPHIFRLSWQWN